MMCEIIRILLIVSLPIFIVAIGAMILHQQSLESRARNAYKALMYDAEETRNAIMSEARRHRR